ncbi:hypothetical protein Hanom_Chr10g00906911 [Helianthus anomalus]
MGVLGEFKRGVDVAHGDWFGVREGTHLLGVHPLHPNPHNFHFLSPSSTSFSFLPCLHYFPFTPHILHEVIMMLCSFSTLHTN